MIKIKKQIQARSAFLFTKGATSHIRAVLIKRDHNTIILTMTPDQNVGDKEEFEKIRDILNTKKRWMADDKDGNHFIGKFSTILEAIGSLRHARICVYEN